MAGTDDYASLGVDTGAAERALKGLAACITETHSFRDQRGHGRPLRGLGYYANVLDLGTGQGLAVASDGVGTKLMVAEILQKYDTVGIDCIAMNVNDLICVGAEPLALLDYIAVGRADEKVLAEVGKGLLEGARQCAITIPGGEIAQVREMLATPGRQRGSTWSERRSEPFPSIGSCGVRTSDPATSSSVSNPADSTATASPSPARSWLPSHPTTPATTRRSDARSARNCSSRPPSTSPWPTTCRASGSRSTPSATSPATVT